MCMQMSPRDLHGHWDDVEHPIPAGESWGMENTLFYDQDGVHQVNSPGWVCSKIAWGLKGGRFWSWLLEYVLFCSWLFVIEGCTVFNRIALLEREPARWPRCWIKL